MGDSKTASQQSTDSDEIQPQKTKLKSKLKLKSKKSSEPMIVPVFHLESFDDPESQSLENDLSNNAPAPNGTTVVESSLNNNHTRFEEDQGIHNPSYAESPSSDDLIGSCGGQMDQQSKCKGTCLELPETVGGCDKTCPAPQRERKLSMTSMINQSAVLEEYRRRSIKPDVNFYVGDFVERITCHGLADWYQSKSRPSFLFWGFVFGAATAILIYSVYQCLYEFYVNPIQTSINVEPYESMLFPDVYICPSNFINKSIYFRQTQEILDRINIFQTAAEASDGGLIGLKSVISDLVKTSVNKHDLDLRIPKLVRQQSEILNVSLDPKSFIPECRFANGADCTQNISRILDKDRGVCYLINMQGVHQTIDHKGVSIVVDLLLELAPKETPPLTDGIWVGLHTKFDPVASDFVLIGAGTFNQLQLTALTEHFVSVSTFSKTPQTCNGPGDVKFQVLNVEYSRQACLFDCAQQVFHTTKNCLLPIDVAYLQTSYLNTTKWCDKSQILSGKYDAAYEDCSKKCHHACDKQNVGTSLSSHRLPSLNYRTNKNLIQLSKDGGNSFNRLRDVERWENNAIVMEIAFKTLEVTSVSQSKSMTLNTLLSNLGGAFGLWLGASLFTVLQFLVFLFKLCITVCCSKYADYFNIDKPNSGN